jgi:hypothetical protein
LRAQTKLSLSRPLFARCAALLLVTLASLPVRAHVKWFTDGSYADKPVPPADIFSPLFFQLAALTVAVVALGVWLDAQLGSWRAYQRIDSWLSERANVAPLVLRIALAMSMLLSWQDDSLLVPNVGIKEVWFGWYQFGIALLLLMPRTVPLAGAATLVLYGLALTRLSTFHMLDYALYAGVGWYLLVSRTPAGKPLRKSGLVVLYLTVGFSLCWVALEKFVYPEWAFQIIREHNLNMGMDLPLFLGGAAFVEFGLGYLIILCMLQRPLAVIITLVFFTTTMVFGKVEVIGHTLLHGCLLVFLLEGGSSIYNRIRRYLPSQPARMSFAVAGMIALFPLLLYPYSYLAAKKYSNKMGTVMYGSHHEHIPLEYPSDMPRPTVKLNVSPDIFGGYNVHLETENFRFAPEKAGRAHVFGEGHAHLYLNDKKIARVYSNWYHIPDLPQGEYDVEVSLHGNGHELLTWGGEPIRDNVKLSAPKTRVEEMHHDMR